MTKIKLHDIIKNSYDSKNKQVNAFQSQGYIYDPDSNDNEQIYYNPKEKKLLFSVTGTHNLSDWGTDAYLGLGHLKDTNRYKEAEEKLKSAKKKYNVDNAVVVGHSLGGAVGQYIAGKDDKVYTLDKGATIGQKTRSNEDAYRTSGDVVSLLNANSTRMHTLKNPNMSYSGFGLLGTLYDAFNAHSKDNIKDEDIYV